MPSLVSQFPAALPADALAHFSHRLAFETDCSDVNDALQNGEQDFLLLDVRHAAAFARGHVPGALNLPTREIDARRMAQFPAGSLFVVYCAGPHCNGVHRAAAKLAALGLPVKEMIGGVTGWLDEGLALAGTDEAPAAGGAGISCAC
ncbi:rhodanese-like domain-containing protein [Pseudomonas sp. GD04087]|uniref:rhodanese-like domain-containing protein n=1 Tax=unclassified Pseudomonas TaxID=196821 RepID=UPI00244945DA|nr:MULTISPECIES: rhodanese-like domain-containing protein [unclassified Pseudomonas]MDH0290680.1 rhodanese-like domain-containing protein [Pseudomonas sp. GD04087]MDH1050509.1 rhodanese-like domain-containing protein [Pseudomonas sp. GD03903]MDH2000343.1 rhodanese-like domain-containing protein [Pseudomonas sp. GD03691]